VVLLLFVLGPDRKPKSETLWTWTEAEGEEVVVEKAGEEGADDKVEEDEADNKHLKCTLRCYRK
jgi:hypothetical protein